MVVLKTKKLLIFWWYRKIFLGLHDYMYKLHKHFRYYRYLKAFSARHLLSRIQIVCVCIGLYLSPRRWWCFRWCDTYIRKPENCSKSQLKLHFAIIYTREREGRKCNVICQDNENWKNFMRSIKAYKRMPLLFKNPYILMSTRCIRGYG